VEFEGAERENMATADGRAVLLCRLQCRSADISFLSGGFTPGVGNYACPGEYSAIYSGKNYGWRQERPVVAQVERQQMHLRTGMESKP